MGCTKYADDIIIWQIELASMNYFVYVLENKQDKTWYIGFTNNLERRFREHQAGKSFYTSRGEVGWEMVYAEMYLNKADALGWEKFLKSGSGHRFLKKQLTNYLSQQTVL